jgi:hypothetical protein
VETSKRDLAEISPKLSSVYAQLTISCRLFSRAHGYLKHALDEAAFDPGEAPSRDHVAHHPTQQRLGSARRKPDPRILLADAAVFGPVPCDDDVPFRGCQFVYKSEAAPKRGRKRRKLMPKVKSHKSRARLRITDDMLEAMDRAIEQMNEQELADLHAAAEIPEWVYEVAMVAKLDDANECIVIRDVDLEGTAEERAAKVKRFSEWLKENDGGVKPYWDRLRQRIMQ